MLLYIYKLLEGNLFLLYNALNFPRIYYSSSSKSLYAFIFSLFTDKELK